jgi:hypothetical protein
LRAAWRAAVRAGARARPAYASRAPPAPDPTRRSIRSSRIHDAAEEDESLLTITTTHTFANTWLAWRLARSRWLIRNLPFAWRPATKWSISRPGRRHRHPRRTRETGSPGMPQAFRIPVHADGEPRLHLGGGAQDTDAQARARTCPNAHLIIRAMTGGSNGSATMVSPRRAALRRPGIRLDNQANEAMRQWRGRLCATDALPLARRRSGRAGWSFRSRIAFRLAAGPTGLPAARAAHGAEVKRFREWLLAVMEEAKTIRPDMTARCLRRPSRPADRAAARPCPPAARPANLAATASCELPRSIERRDIAVASIHSAPTPFRPRRGNKLDTPA